MVRFSQNHGAQPAHWMGWILGLFTWMVLFVLISAAPMRAQLTGKGAIHGVVSDSSGAALPSAAIVATNTGSGFEYKSTSTGTGDFRFSNLEPGIYTLTVTATGFSTFSQQNIHVNAMEAQAVNPVMQVGSQTQVVTVTDEPPQLETSNATLGATLEQETYSELPVMMGAYGQADQRRATDFVFLMPGVQGNNTNGNATTNTGVVNGSGSRGAVSTVYIDGIPFVRAGGNGDPRYVWTAISVDAVDQFQLQTTGYSAVYEGQGVMNYSVKQGTPKYHGSLYEFFRNTALDTWGFWGKASNGTLPATKPVEHSNEYGINISGPLIPFGSLKNKLFFFTNYNGFRYTSQNPTQISFPTAAMQAGDFSALGVAIYDPSTQTACTANSTTGACRYQYGYKAGSAKGAAGNPVVSGAAVNVIPASQFSSVAVAMQSFLKSIPVGTASQNNYIAANPTGLNNWSTTSRIDYAINARDTLSILGAVGRQASSVPVGQTTSGRNVGPLPYNYGQAYAPKTAVWSIELTHVFSPQLINQLKWGYARYNGPSFNPNNNPAYAASAMGIKGLPVGQASDMFPIVTFAGTNAPTQWNGQTENSTIASNYTVLDNVQWNVGKHSFIFGGQTAWLLYNVNNATNGGSTPITLATAVTETAAITGTKVTSGTGNAYASFLLGQIDKGSFTQYIQQVFGARFRAISGYAQDNWKVAKNLTLDVGLRYDFFPTVTEVHNAQSFFDPNLANPVTGLNGALQFTGFGSGTCNCETPANNYFGHWGPRLGIAYQPTSKTVVRASYGVMYTHGNAVGGMNTTIGTLGFSTPPTFSLNGTTLQTTMTGLLAGGNGSIPSYTSAAGTASGVAYGTGYTKTTGYTSAPSTAFYNDPYLGGRAPEYINWSFGIQTELSRAAAFILTYVGSQGHFLQADDANARGYWSNALDPKYLYLGDRLSDTGSTATTVTQDCTNYSLPCAGLSNFTTSQGLSQLLKPFPFHAITDNFGQYVGNSNYHSLQAQLNMRSWHGLTMNVNYTWSKAMDNAGYFRSGYAIPAGRVYGSSAAYSERSIDRSVSTSSQPHHAVATVVWNMPFGKTVLNDSRFERMLMGGFTLSGVFQAYSGSPLMITNANCTASNNPALPNPSRFCPLVLNPNFSGPVQINGKWGQGVTTGNAGTLKFLDSNAFIAAPNYTFGNSPRTAPYGIYGPGNYQLDLALVRSFPLHLTESTKLKLRAEWYNVTNHTFFAPAASNGALQWGNANFGTVTSNGSANRKAAQLSARIEF